MRDGAWAAGLRAAGPVPGIWSKSGGVGGCGGFCGAVGLWAVGLYLGLWGVGGWEYGRVVWVWNVYLCIEGALPLSLAHVIISVCVATPW